MRSAAGFESLDELMILVKVDTILAVYLFSVPYGVFDSLIVFVDFSAFLVCILCIVFIFGIIREQLPPAERAGVLSFLQEPNFNALYISQSAELFYKHIIHEP